MTRRSFGAALVFVAACGGLGDGDAGETNLPSAEMGPFRALVTGEVKGTAPFVLDDKVGQYADPAALDDGSLYVVTAGKIARTSAPNGRTFAAPAVVLKADPTGWEGIALSGPWALRRPGAIWLYYAAKGGIGLATSPDGVAFAKRPAPVLAGTGRSPSVYALPDGRLRMMYGDGAGISEAESSDGVTWRTLGAVLGPSGPGGGFDAAAVGDPCVVPWTTPAGRYQVRVLYTGTDATGATEVGFAGRFGEDGPLTRNPTPAYTAGKAPAYLAPFLYVTQLDGSHGAVGAAVLPGAALSPP